MFMSRVVRYITRHIDRLERAIEIVDSMPNPKVTLIHGPHNILVLEAINYQGVCIYRYVAVGDDKIDELVEATKHYKPFITGERNLA